MQPSPPPRLWQPAPRKSPPPNFENDKVAPVSEGSRVIAVSFAPQTKTTLYGLQPKFSLNDSILISNGETLDTCKVKIDDKTGAATISTDLTGPLTAVYPYKAAKMNGDNANQIDSVLVSTEQDGTFASANICMAKNISEDAKAATFENKTALFCITPGADSGTQYVEVSAEGFGIANDVLTGSEFKNYDKIHVATTTADSVWVSILVPENLTIGDLSFYDGTNKKAVTTGAKASELVKVSTLYKVTDEGWKNPEADVPDGALPGVFTVSAGPDGIAGTDDDVKVYFSQGNLVATIDASGNPTAWKFAAKQYDRLGEGGANKTIGTTAGDVDLFGWSTDASSNNWGIHRKTSHISGVTTGSFNDWGKAIEDGNIWRTLSKDEWTYLFNTRTASTVSGTDNARYAKATVNSKAGIILFPDTYVHPSGAADFTKINNPTDAAFVANSFELPDWAKMEFAGAVFLPATAGSREGSTVYSDFSCSYWSSSPATQEKSATRMDFNVDIVRLIGDFRYMGHFVRLVTDVSAAPDPINPPVADLPEGALSGAFTVSDNGTPNDPSDDVKVHFSQGNLVASIDASGNPTAWKFATNQYDYLGTGGANKTIGTTAGDVDLFGWSTDASSNNWGIHTKKKATTDTTTGQFNDWGKAYCEQEGLDDSTWKTLSTAEWQYLFDTNTKRKGKYKCAVTVCDKEDCVILLPDNWDTTVISLENFAATTAYNNSSTPTWSAMEAAGAVCLPAAGYREGFNVYGVGNFGFCWSSSSSFNTDAWRLGFSGEGAGPGGLGNRYLGYSVRLVTESN